MKINSIKYSLLFLRAKNILLILIVYFEVIKILNSDISVHFSMSNSNRDKSIINTRGQSSTTTHIDPRTSFFNPVPNKIAMFNNFMLHKGQFVGIIVRKSREQLKLGQIDLPTDFSIVKKVAIPVHAAIDQ